MFIKLHCAKKVKFSIKDFFRISHLLKKSLMENFIFCAVLVFELGTVAKYRF